MFIRFVIGAEDENHRLLTGLITEARLLRDKNAFSSHEVKLLENIYEWFNANLPCPPFKKSDWPRDVVTWFKDDATDAIKKMRELSVLLEQHGKLVRMLKSKNPGKILYEDKFQVVVEEWNKL